MTIRSCLYLFLIFFIGDAFARAADEPVVKVVTLDKQFKKSADYQDIVTKEHNYGNIVKIYKIIDWAYKGQSGRFALLNIKNRKYNSCVIYQITESKTIPLGGIDYCRWSGNPYVKWDKNIAWIEIPKHLQPAPDPQKGTTEITVHFEKSMRNICILGLASGGYANLRCPDDVAPESR